VIEIEKGVDELGSDTSLHIAQLKTRDQVHIYVSHGPKELVIVKVKDEWATITINGLLGSVEQGRLVFNELLERSSQVEFPRFGVRNRQTYKVSYKREFETAQLWKDDLVTLTNDIIEADLTIRRCTTDEVASMIATAESIERTFHMMR